MARRKEISSCCLALSLLISLWVTNRASAKDESPGDTEAVAYFTEPAVSPDRSEIAFVSAGDIWTVHADHTIS